MKSISNLNLLDKARRHYRGERAKIPTLPALVPGGGEVKANGRLRIVLPLTDGSVITYSAAPCVEWRLTFESQDYEHPSALKEVTQGDRAHQALDVLLNVLTEAESRVCAAQPQSDSANLSVN